MNSSVLFCAKPSGLLYKGFHVTHPWTDVEINTFVQNKVLLHRLYYGTCNQSIKLKINVNR